MFVTRIVVDGVVYTFSGKTQTESEAKALEFRKECN